MNNENMINPTETEDNNSEGYELTLTLTPAYIFYTAVNDFNLKVGDDFKFPLYDSAYKSFLNSMIQYGYINRDVENDDRSE